MKLKLIILSIMTLFFMTFLPVVAQEINNPAQSSSLGYATGQVIKIFDETHNKVLEETMGGNQVTQFILVKITSGKHKGKLVQVQNQLTSNPAYNINLKPGSRVVLDIEENGKYFDVNIADNERSPALMIEVGLFLILLLAIGGFKGLRSLFSLLVTAVLVFLIMIPSILHGFPIIPVAILVALFSTLFTMFTIGGFNLKSISACIGTLGGVIISGIFSTLVIKFAPLNGFADQESVILWASRPDLNFTGLLSAAMIIGSLGAIMDVGISIASSIAEVKSIDSSLKIPDLIRSGMNVGKDIMGAMSNTLILAYIGGALPLILLAANAPLIKILNLNSIAAEITAALAGSIGIILCVPITAVVSGYLMGTRSHLDTQSPEE